MEKKYLAIFDLDGTLFDTSEVNYYAYKEALSLYGVDLDKNYFITSCNGRHYTEFLPTIMSDRTHIEDVHIAKKVNYKKNLDKAHINKHLFEIIQCIQATYHLAIVTTASHQNCMDILSHYGYVDLFEKIFSQEDITKAKPNPQGFLMCMDYFGMTSRQTIIFEDSDVGIAAARASGASVFVVNKI